MASIPVKHYKYILNRMMLSRGVGTTMVTTATVVPTLAILWFHHHYCDRYATNYIQTLKFMHHEKWSHMHVELTESNPGAREWLLLKIISQTILENCAPPNFLCYT